MNSQPTEAGEGPRARVQFLIASTMDPLALDGPNVISNLRRTPRQISSVYVYDRVGTRLFERQCDTPEYYLRRVEAELLRSHAAEIVARCGPVPIVELGAGTAEKTRILFAEYRSRGARCDYFPIDVDTHTLDRAAHRLASEYPNLFVHCLGTTYRDGLRALDAHPQHKLFLFLGSSIGNMAIRDIEELLADLSRYSSRGDHLVLGADLHKDAAIIDRAYNDSAGYGARSALNALSHLNRRYGANFALDRFRYLSKYDPGAMRNEVRFESLVDQTVTLAKLGFTVSFAASELIDAEVMWKFDPDALCALLSQAGWEEAERWIDPIYRYGVFRLRRR
jgi:L-histidine N-alpha-methyltransferase